MSKPGHGARLFLEAMLADGGYFAGVEEADFVDSGEYPETHDDGIARDSGGGVAADTIVPRAEDYLAPVCHHFGENHVELLAGLADVTAVSRDSEDDIAARPCAVIGGLEKWGFGVECLGTSVPIDKVLDAAVEYAASAVLISTIITHADIHHEGMQKLVDLAAEKGVRERLLLISGDTQVTDERSRAWGMDAGFGRRTKGADVASFIVRAMFERGM